jgi:ATP phosphoribosyltransferase
MNDLRIVLPNAGRIKNEVIELLKKAGYDLGTVTDEACVRKANFVVLFANINDIPSIVKDGGAEIGITEEYVLHEQKNGIPILLKLNFGGCRLVVAAPPGSPINSLEDVPDGTKVATLFPNLTEEFFYRYFKHVKIVKVSSSMEILSNMELSDLIVDLAPEDISISGKSLKELGTIMKSTAVVITNTKIYNDKKDLIDSFIFSIESTMHGTTLKNMIAEIPKDRLDSIKSLFRKIIHCSESYQEPDFLTINALIDASLVNKAIKEIKDIDGKEIIVLDLKRYFGNNRDSANL